MSRRSYSKKMDEALRPLGFQRSGLDWIRVRGEYEETVNIQQMRPRGRTVALYIKNLETEKLFLEIFAAEGAIRMGSISDKFDRSWYDEPNGPEEMADLTVRFGLPWFDQVRILEEQMAKKGAQFSEAMRGYHGPTLIRLALRLYRMGELAEACAVLRKPVPRTASKSSVRDVARVREWLGCDQLYPTAATKN